MAVVLPVPVLRAGAWIRASLSSSARAWVIGEARKIALSTRYETPQDLILRAEIRERFGPELRGLGSKSSTEVLNALRFAVLSEAIAEASDMLDQTAEEIRQILDTIAKIMEAEDETLQGIINNLS
jgi:hypothetical protein